MNAVADEAVAEEVVSVDVDFDMDMEMAMEETLASDMWNYKEVVLIINQIVDPYFIEESLVVDPYIMEKTLVVDPYFIESYEEDAAEWFTFKNLLYDID